MTLLLLSMLISADAWATTHAVPGDFSTVAAAVSAAADGDTIELAPGTYSAKLDLNGSFNSTGLVIQSDGSGDVTLQAGGLSEDTAGNLVRVRGGSKLTLIDMRVRADTTRAMSVEGSSTLVLQEVEVSGERKNAEGIGVQCSGSSTLEIFDSLFHDNKRQNGNVEGAHLHLTDCTTTITDTDLTSGETSNGHGGAIFVDGGSLTTVRGTLADNEAMSDRDGGAIYAVDTTLDITDTAFNTNKSSDLGGAVWLSGTTTASFTDATFTDNDANDDGGAIGGNGIISLTVSGGTFTGNAGYDGADIFLQGAGSTLDLSNTSHNDSDPDDEGAVAAVDADSVSISGSDFTNISSRRGAVYLWKTPATIDGSSFTDISSTSTGGAIAATQNDSGTRTLSVTNSTFLRTSASTHGGAVYSTYGGAAVLSGLSFDTTTASQRGGGIYLQNHSPIELSTITCTATETNSNEGGCVYLLNAGDVSVTDLSSTNSVAKTNGGTLFAYNVGDVSWTGGTLSNSVAKSNRAGGVYVQEADDVSLDGLTITGGQATLEGGGVYGLDIASFSLQNSTLTQLSSSTSRGGGVNLLRPGVVTVHDTDFSSLSSKLQGGALYINDADGFSITESSFTDTNAEEDGGALYVNNGGTGTVEDTTFTNTNVITTDQPGGAAYIGGTPTTWTRVTVDAADAGGRGGGLYLNGRAHTITDSTFTNNSSNSGGAIYYANDGNRRTLAIRGSTFTGNRSVGTNQGHGGAIAVNSANQVTFELSDSELCDNTSNDSGGAAWLSAARGPEILRTLFCNNASTSGSDTSNERGGAIHFHGVTSGTTATVTNSLFIENHSDDDGGALSVRTGGVDVVNNHFLGNTSGDDGAVFDARGGRANDFRNNLLWKNVGNSVVIDNDGSGTTTLDYNALYQNTAHQSVDILDTNTHGVTVDPSLTDWTEDDDCSNDDFLPSLGSPLVNAGDPSIEDPDETRSDIGAYGGPSTDTSVVPDVDGDGFNRNSDCNDDDASINPDADEVCDDVDTNCDGSTTLGAVDASTWYTDADDDSRGDPNNTVVACTSPAGTVADNTDCDDTNAEVKPGATELCNAIDDDCDTVIDEDDAADASDWWEDSDNDTYGNPDTMQTACEVPDGFVDNDLDCNDTDGGLNPLTTWYADTDADGFGDPSAASEPQCTKPSGYVRDNTDCNDGEETLNPDAIWFADGDGDGFGNAADTLTQCEQPDGYVTNAGDCDDTDASVPSDLTFFADEDGDGFGDPTSSPPSCTIPDGWVENSADCNDGNGNINPDATDLCDAIDDDCDGEGGPEHDLDNDGLSFTQELNAGADGCSLDSDGDGVPDDIEWGTSGRDTDKDGVLNIIDPDDDGDTVPTALEDLDGDGDPTNDDSDSDGTPDYLDTDDDNDGTLTALEDLDGDGDPTNDDFDEDGIPDYADADDDGDGAPTALEKLWGSDPLNPDTDGDSVSDGDEWGWADQGDGTTPDYATVDWETADNPAPLDSDGDGFFDIFDLDDDNDGIPTLIEGSKDIDGQPFGTCDGLNEDDIFDCAPVGDTIPNHLDENTDGDALLDFEEGTGDSDEDGVLNFLDCNDCDGASADADNDGLTNAQEAQLQTDPYRADSDGDGLTDLEEVGDVDDPTDTDGDGVINANDADDDGDHVDTALELVDGSPVDSDGDGFADHLDDDDDNDTVPTAEESLHGDSDADGVPDHLDDDDNNDGTPTALEDADGDGDPTSDDVDGDDIPDYRDLDDSDGPLGDGDQDGLTTAEEEAAGTDPNNPDTDGDGIPDGAEVDNPDADPNNDDDDNDGIPTADEGVFDLDGDGIPNWLDTDSDGDGLLDADESGLDVDCDGQDDAFDIDNSGPCDGTTDTSWEPSNESVAGPPPLCGCSGGQSGGTAFVFGLLLALRRRGAGKETVTA